MLLPFFSRMLVNMESWMEGEARGDCTYCSSQTGSCGACTTMMYLMDNQPSLSWDLSKYCTIELLRGVKDSNSFTTGSCNSLGWPIWWRWVFHELTTAAHCGNSQSWGQSWRRYTNFGGWGTVQVKSKGQIFYQTHNEEKAGRNQTTVHRHSKTKQQTGKDKMPCFLGKPATSVADLYYSNETTFWVQQICDCKPMKIEVHNANGSFWSVEQLGGQCNWMTLKLVIDSM